MSVTIYHNPDCGTSRNVLALLREAGEHPRVVEYLKTPPDRAMLERLIAASGMAVRDVLRIKGTPYQALRLDDTSLTDDQLLDAIIAHPILMNRPIVVTPRGTRLCRPSDAVIDLLATPPQSEFLKEEGVPFFIARKISGDDPALAQALTAANLPVDDLDDLDAPGRRLFSFSTLAGLHVGFGGFEQYGNDVLIRSVVVEPALRGKHVGRNLVAMLLREAFDLRARTAWLLATDASAFFEKTGFRPVDRDGAPASILATRQATALCPTTASLLTRTLTL